MKYLLLSIILIMGITETKKKKPFVDFDEKGMGREWRIVNDNVMGGVSQSSIEYTENNNLHWWGEVSLENNGGFVSLRSPKDTYKLGKYDGLKIRMKGDGREYGFTLRNVTYFNGISYTYYWPTEPGEWTEVKVPFADIKGTYFGNADPRIDPLDYDEIKEIGVILYDKKGGPFDVEIDYIDVY